MAVDDNRDSKDAGVTQVQRFRDLARDLEADEDEARWDERLKKVARHKPAPGEEKPE